MGGAGLTALALAGPAAAQALTDGQRRQIDSVFAASGGTARPGCAVGVSRGGEPVYLRGFDMADLHHGLAIARASVIHVASVSKRFAAFAVALLAEDRRLSLDEDVRKHLPELSDYGTRISIRHLIQQTSGIRDQGERLGLAGVAVSGGPLHPGRRAPDRPASTGAELSARRGIPLQQLGIHAARPHRRTGGCGLPEGGGPGRRRGDRGAPGRT